MEHSADPSTVPNRGPTLVAVNIAFVVGALIANILRCYVRLVMVRAFGLDDCLMVVATLAFVTYGAFSTVGVHYGTGRHYSDLSNDDIARARNCWYYCYLFYSVSMITSKLSIGYLLLRIAIKKIHIWIIYLAMFISVVAGATFFFVTMFQCKPMSYFWNKHRSTDGTCVDGEVIVGLAFLYSSFSIISDFTFAILPGFLVWNLQLKTRTRLALIPLLTMGCIASSAVIARLPYLSKINSVDFLWETADVAVWSTVEQGLAITAGSLATLRPLLHLAAHKLGISTHSRTRPSNYGNPSPFSSQMLGSRRRPSQANDLEAFKMSSVIDSQNPKDTKIEEADMSIQSPTWYSPNLEKMKSPRGSIFKKGRVADDNESQKSLKAESTKGSSKGSLDQDGMRIMVKKSFFITDESRPSSTVSGGKI